MFEHPKSELLPNLRFENALDHLDTRITQNHDALTVDARMRIAHANYHARDTARGNRARTRRRASVKGARLECGIQCCEGNAMPARLGIASRGDLGVVFARTLRVTAANQFTTRAHDHASNPRVVPGRASREIPLLDGELH